MMCELLVEGGERLYGELTIQGSKNSVLPILAAAWRDADFTLERKTELWEDRIPAAGSAKRC